MVASSEIEAIASDLAQALTTVAQAQHQTMATAEHAGQVAARAAATGLQGVAIAMSGIRDQIKAVHEIIANAAALGQAAGLTAREVGDQMGLQEAKAHLAISTGKIDATIAETGQLGN